MEKQRIPVYVDPETKRRIELAAAKYHMPVTEYCLNAIRQQLADDDLLEEEQITIPVLSGDDRGDDDLIADLRALRNRILTRRGGQPIDIDIVEQVRAERDEELLGLY